MRGEVCVGVAVEEPLVVVVDETKRGAGFLNLQVCTRARFED